VAYSALDVIPPGASAPLAALFSVAPAEIAAAQATLLSASPAPPADSPRYLPLEVPAHQGAASGAGWAVTGQVRNPSSVAAGSAWLTLTLYDATGAILGYRKQALAGGLPAGATLEFSISATPLSGAVDRYVIAAEGRP
jgi:hypothetical protein